MFLQPSLQRIANLPLMTSSKPFRVLIGTFVAVLLTSCGSSKSSTTTTTTANTEFVFVADLDSSLIDAFTFDSSTGSLVRLANSPIASDYRPISIAVHPTKDNFYVANSGNSTTCGTGGAPGSITTYSYDKTGLPTKVAEHCLPGSPQQLLISSDGSTVYALLTGGQITTLTVGGSADVTMTNTVAVAGGALRHHARDLHEIRVPIRAHGRSLPRRLRHRLAARGGALSARRQASEPADAGPRQERPVHPADLACCNGTSLYMVDENARLLAQGTVSTGGSPASFVLGGTAATDQFPNHVAYDNAGKNLLVTNLTTALLSPFPVDPTTGAPQVQKPQLPTGTFPTCVFGEPSGKYFFVTNYHANSISAFSLTSGALASSGTGTTGSSPICGAGAHTFM